MVKLIFLLLSAGELGTLISLTSTNFSLSNFQFILFPNWMVTNCMIVQIVKLPFDGTRRIDLLYKHGILTLKVNYVLLDDLFQYNLHLVANVEILLWVSSGVRK